MRAHVEQSTYIAQGEPSRRSEESTEAVLYVDGEGVYTCTAFTACWSTSDSREELGVVPKKEGNGSVAEILTEAQGRTTRAYTRPTGLPGLLTRPL